MYASIIIKNKNASFEVSVNSEKSVQLIFKDGEFNDVTIHCTLEIIEKIKQYLIVGKFETH